MTDAVEQFFAAIGAVVCLVVVIRGVYWAAQIGPGGWGQAISERVARIYWRVPKKTLIVLPARADNVWWEMGQRDGLPCMQILGEFFFTNISTDPVSIPKTYLVVYGSRYVFLPTRRLVEGTILVRQAQGYLYGHTDIPARELTAGRADWVVQPPLRMEGQLLRGRACFIDGYGNEHWTPIMTWQHKA